MFKIVNASTPEEIMDDIVGDWVNGLENWCLIFNDYVLIFFQYMKYILSFILFLIGILTLLKLRGIYLKIRKNDVPEDEDKLITARLFLGWTYIFIGLGILFNYFTFFLMWLLDPLPDRFFFQFINFYGGIHPDQLNRIEYITYSLYPHEKTIYYAVALGSFASIIEIVIFIWYLINNNRLINNPGGPVKALSGALFQGIMFGFTTCLPFFI